MSAPVKGLTPLKLPSGPSPITPEQKYWKSFKTPTIIPSPSNNPVTYISAPAPPLNAATTPSDYFAATSGTRVHIYSVRSKKLVKTISRFNDIAHGAEIRRDGKILISGDETGSIQAFDIGSRAILKTWKEHKQPVWTTKFSLSDPTAVMSTSDDTTVRLWDLSAQDSTIQFKGHEDYTRCGGFMPGQPSTLLCSGSYDGTVKLWDSRASSSAVTTFKHTAPVEAVLPMPSGTTLLTAADSYIHVLDIVGGKPLKRIQNHQKTVTSLSLASGDSRLVAGGLDGHLKVFETTGWNVVYGMKYPSPILALSVITSNREDRHLAVGLQSGALSLRTRLTGVQKTREKERQKEMEALLEGKLEEHDKKRKRKSSNSARHRFRGKGFDGEGADVIIQGNPSRSRKKLRPFEQELRNGNYSRALDLALDEQNPVIAATVLTSLRHRSAQHAALAGRNDSTLRPILRWVRKHIIDPRYVVVCVETGTLILDTYSHIVGQSREIDDLVSQLHKQVRRHTDLAQQAWQTEGMLNLLLKP